VLGHLDETRLFFLARLATLFF